MTGAFSNSTISDWFEMHPGRYCNLPTPKEVEHACVLIYEEIDLLCRLFSSVARKRGTVVRDRICARVYSVF